MMMMLVLVFLSVFLSAGAEDPLDFDVYRLAGDLRLTCALTNLTAYGLTKVTSIQVSRTDGNGPDLILASISSNTNWQPNSSVSDVSATGYASKSPPQNTYLFVTWSRPYFNFSGDYSCQVEAVSSSNVTLTYVSYQTVWPQPAATELSASVTFIDVGVTDQLTVECRLPDPDLFNLTRVISIRLSVMTDSREELLAEVDTFSGLSGKVGVSGAKVGGVIGGDNQESFLSVQWSSPNASQSGVYKCQTVAFDAGSHWLQSFSRAVQVTASQTNDGSCQYLTSENSQLSAENSVLRQQLNSTTELLRQRELELTQCGVDIIG